MPPHKERFPDLTQTEPNRLVVDICTVTARRQPGFTLTLRVTFKSTGRLSPFLKTPINLKLFPVLRRPYCNSKLIFQDNPKANPQGWTKKDTSFSIGKWPNTNENDHAWYASCRELNLIRWQAAGIDQLLDLCFALPSGGNHAPFTSAMCFWDSACNCFRLTCGDVIVGSFIWGGIEEKIKKKEAMEGVTDFDHQTVDNSVPFNSMPPDHIFTQESPSAVWPSPRPLDMRSHVDIDLMRG